MNASGGISLSRVIVSDPSHVSRSTRADAGVRHRAPVGSAIAVHLGSSVDPSVVRRLLWRPPGVSLVVTASRSAYQDRAIVEALGQEVPTAVIPTEMVLHENEIRELLRAPPMDFSSTVLDYIDWRGFSINPEVKSLTLAVLDGSRKMRSITSLTKSIYVSRRALSRSFRRHGMPPPSRWLQVGRAIRTVILATSSRVPLAEASRRLGYSDYFAFSNQFFRLLGVRPSRARRMLGWLWMVETWLRKEGLEGYFGNPDTRPSPDRESFPRILYI